MKILFTYRESRKVSIHDSSETPTVKYCLTIGPSNASYKLHALRCMRNNLAAVKAKLLGNAFIHSQFNSTLLIQMFCLMTLYLKIEKIHHKTLRIIYQSHTTYRDLLECNGSTSFHQRYLQFLLTEIYKSIVITNPMFMQHFFREREAPYNLKKSVVVFVPPARSTTRGENSIHFRGTLIWNQLSSSIKSSQSIIES